MSSPNKSEGDKGDSKPRARIKDDSAEERASNSSKKRRRLKFEETINPHAECIREITEMDIIFGRGRGFQEHPGNRRMRTIVGRHKAEYRDLEISQKRGLVESVYDEIVANGARFLHKQGETEEDGYVIVEVPVALQKVRNLLRCKKVYGKKPETSGPSEDMVPTNLAFAALTEVSENQSLPIQLPLVAQGAGISLPLLPFNQLSSSPLLALEQIQQATLASRHHAMLNPMAGLQPNTGSLPGAFPMQLASIAASNTATTIGQLQMLQQYQQLRAEELANLIKPKTEEDDSRVTVCRAHSQYK